MTTEQMLEFYRRQESYHQERAKHYSQQIKRIETKGKKK